jgi:hypothetical protein
LKLPRQSEAAIKPTLELRWSGSDHGKYLIYQGGLYGRFKVQGSEFNGGQGWGFHVSDFKNGT